MSQVNAVHVIDALALGGAERIAVELANGLAAAGARITLCASRTGGPLEAELSPTVDFVNLGRRRRWDGLDRLAALIRDRRPDIVHSHGRPSMRLVAATATLHRLPVTHVFHDHSSAGADARPRLVAESLSVRVGVDAYIGVDRRLVDRMAGHLPPSAAHLVRNWVDVRRFVIEPANVRGLFRLVGAELVVAVVANLHPPKDHLSALAAIGAVRTPRLGALLIGVASDPAYDVAVRLAIEERGIGDRVAITGPRSDVPALLRGCDLALFASQRESGPLAVLEGLAAGLPTVTTDTGELVAALAPHGVLRIVPSGDRDRLAAELESLAQLPAGERRALGERGRSVVAAEFGVDAAVRQVMAIYEDALSGAGRRTRLRTRRAASRGRTRRGPEPGRSPPS